MVAEWIMAAASTGGAALVGAAANEAWQQARRGVVALFTRAGRRPETVERWADETAAAIEQAPVGERDRLREQWVPTWVGRLADLLDEHPDLEEELKNWAAQIDHRLPTAQQSWVQTYIARDHANQYIAPYGVITVHHHRDGPAES